MEKQLVMGVDIGTSGCKTLLIDDRGRAIARAVKEHPLSIPKPGWSEQDPEDSWKATKLTIKRE
jgi:xylulokinase